MSRQDHSRLRRARDSDLPSIAALRETVGWGVHDWALRAVVELPEARCFVLDEGDRVVAVGSGIAYGRFGVVGNMVVDPRHRRRGIGSMILSAVVEFLRGRGCVRLELSATDLGRPLYARHGFTADGDGASVVLNRAGVESVGTHTIEHAPGTALDEIVEYDAPRFGGDRRGLIGRMLVDTSRPLLVVRRGRILRGWAWVRPEADRIGPLVADEPNDALSLLAAGMAAMPGARTVRLNLPPGNRSGRAALARAGAEVEPWDGRMSLGPSIPRREDTIYGSSVGALG